MIRFNMVRNLLVASALLIGASAVGGCAAQPTSPSDADQSDNPLGRTELVAVDGNGGSSLAPNAERSAGGPTPFGGEANGARPEPWTGIDDPNDPTPAEPPRPKKIAPDPDPASAAPPKP